MRTQNSAMGTSDLGLTRCRQIMKPRLVAQLAGCLRCSLTLRRGSLGCLGQVNAELDPDSLAEKRAQVNVAQQRRRLKLEVRTDWQSRGGTWGHPQVQLVYGRMSGLAFKMHSPYMTEKLQHNLEPAISECILEGDPSATRFHR